MGEFLFQFCHFSLSLSLSLSVYFHLYSPLSLRICNGKTSFCLLQKSLSRQQRKASTATNTKSTVQLKLHLIYSNNGVHANTIHSKLEMQPLNNRLLCVNKSAIGKLKIELKSAFISKIVGLHGLAAQSQWNWIVPGEVDVGTTTATTKISQYHAKWLYKWGNNEKFNGEYKGNGKQRFHCKIYECTTYIHCLCADTTSTQVKIIFFFFDRWNECIEYPHIIFGNKRQLPSCIRFYDLLSHLFEDE